MTTAAWSTFLDQSSDAAFRTWGLELNGKFSGVGMVQTTDTGQVNWSTVTRASANTAAGYEIWKLSSGNLFFKIEYGSGTTNAIPAIFLTVGTGSNGSGTLTGQLSTRQELGDATTAISSTTTNYQSYLCATANYFALSHKIASAGVANKPRSYMAAMQTVDATGAATSVGYAVAYNISGSTFGYQCVATTAAVTGTQIVSVKGQFLVPCNTAAPPTNSLDGSGNNQAFLWWHNILGTTPMTPLLHMASVLASDLAVGVSASMTLIGATAHTYINAGVSMTQDAAAVIPTINLGTLMMYE